jgi:hypothetical protein
MNRANQAHLRTIHILIEPELLDKLKSGPLSATNGRGIASHVRKLINESVETYAEQKTGKSA